MEGNIPSFSSEGNESSRLMPEMSPIPNTSSPSRESTSYGNPPLQDERSTLSGQEYNMKAFWVMTMLYILSPLLIIIASATYAGYAQFSLTILGIGVLFFLYAQISLLINTWKAWKCIQAITQYGRRIPSAGQAVGLLFVPVFHLYWMYVCFVGLVDNASWLARVSQQTKLRLKAWPMFAFVLFTQLTFGSCIITNGFLPEFRPFLISFPGFGYHGRSPCSGTLKELFSHFLVLKEGKGNLHRKRKQDEVLFDQATGRNSNGAVPMGEDR